MVQCTQNMWRSESMPLDKWSIEPWFGDLTICGGWMLMLLNGWSNRGSVHWQYVEVWILMLLDGWSNHGSVHSQYVEVWIHVIRYMVDQPMVWCTHNKGRSELMLLGGWSNDGSVHSQYVEVWILMLLELPGVLIYFWMDNRIYFWMEADNRIYFWMAANNRIFFLTNQYTEPRFSQELLLLLLQH
jgi:hypothetical protein